MDSFLSKIQREAVRWRILATLNAGRPVAMNEELILSVLADLSLPATMMDLRRELDYLEARELLEVLDRETTPWVAKLTRHGIDVAEYTVKVEPGIARPPRM